MLYLYGMNNNNTHSVKRSIIEIIKQNCELDKSIKHQVNQNYHIEWLESDDTWSVINSFGFGCFSSIDFEECKKTIKCKLKK
jgi:hypothetical protein